jgi:hypothetical protein
MKRRVAFVALALAGLVALWFAVRAGDPEMVHRLAAQI